jgi:hypothetical protein
MYVNELRGANFWSTRIVNRMSFFQKKNCSNGGNERSLSLVVLENKEAIERKGERANERILQFIFGHITCLEKTGGMYSPTI